MRPWAPATNAVPSRARHRAPESALGAAVAFSSSGRHADAEWDRELYDPRFDEDPFAWLGFGSEQV